MVLIFSIEESLDIQDRDTGINCLFELIEKTDKLKIICTYDAD